MRISILSHFVISILVFSHFQTNCFAEKQSYIVCLEKNEFNSLSIDIAKVIKSHLDFLAKIFPGVEEIEDQVLYSYSKIINGFAVKLDDVQVELLRNHPEVASVLRNTARKLDTTYSWDFLGLENTKGNIVGTPNQNNTKDPFTREAVGDSLWEKANYGEGIIIGSLDSGVWPESPSFNDVGFGPVPGKWRGFCYRKSGITCNRKLIGARYFHKGYEAENGPLNETLLNALDTVGHGTHTLSIAGGNPIDGVSVFGYGIGTVKGGAPKARVAVYKVCWPATTSSGGCFDADILAAFDTAVADGVDVITMSLGGSGLEMYLDATAFGSFHAMLGSVSVVMSAGNDGPTPGTVKNVAPWVITVGATTTDRKFSSYVTLGNNMTIKGTSLPDKALPIGRFYPLIKGADARVDNASAPEAALCKAGTLDPKKVAGKILLCLRGGIARVEKGLQATLAGAVGMILTNDEATGNQTLAEPHVLPASHISYANGVAICEYIKSTIDPTASISPVKTELGTEPAPMMASFSSRGPNPFELSILKPDMVAPGVNIIAAYPNSIGPSEVESDKRRVLYNVLSGTSMATPHIAGIVALLKAIHPHWSPAAIKSALMTTATTEANNNMPILDSTGQPATPFAYGAGHVRPNLAADPGLVYELTPKDYTDFGYFRSTYPYLQKMISNSTISTSSKIFNLANFNYPTITVPNINGTTTITRRVKNVGSPGTYQVRVQAPPGILVEVKPTNLTFWAIGQEQFYSVIFEPKENGLPKDYVFGWLVWSDGIHNVSSSLVVKHV